MSNQYHKCISLEQRESAAAAAAAVDLQQSNMTASETANDYADKGRQARQAAGNLFTIRFFHS